MVGLVRFELTTKGL